MVSALIGTDGTVLFANASPGVTLTIGHPATGRYSLSASGLGAGSPLPSLTPEGTAAVIYYSGSTSGIGTLNTAVVMADGQDHDWSVTIIGIPFRRRANAGPQIDSAAAPQVGPRLAIGLVTEGEDRRLDAVLQGEFGEDAADVGLDGLLADRQIPGDLPVAVTAGDQPEYFPLAR